MLSTLFLLSSQIKTPNKNTTTATTKTTLFVVQVVPVVVPNKNTTTETTKTTLFVVQVVSVVV